MVPFFQKREDVGVVDLLLNPTGLFRIQCCFALWSRSGVAQNVHHL